MPIAKGATKMREVMICVVAGALELACVGCVSNTTTTQWIIAGNESRSGRWVARLSTAGTAELEHGVDQKTESVTRIDRDRLSRIKRMAAALAKSESRKYGSAVPDGGRLFVTIEGEDGIVRSFEILHLEPHSSQLTDSTFRNVAELWLEIRAYVGVTTDHRVADLLSRDLQRQ